MAPGHPNESEKEGVEDECVKPSWRCQQRYGHRHGDGRSPKEILYRDRCKERLVEETGEANEKPRLRQRRSKGGTPESKAGGGGKMTERCPLGLEESTKHFGDQDSRSKCSREREVNLGKPSMSPKSQ